MAHHSRTPQRVLDAPKSEPVTVYANTGPNRAERRHGLTRAWLKYWREVGAKPNVPYTRTAGARRGKKVKRHPKAGQ